MLNNRTFCFFNFLDGSDSTCLVYGQSGSGKSFTIGTENIFSAASSSSSAPPAQPEGVIQKVISTIFSDITADQELHFRAVEFYNNQTFDLLPSRSVATHPSTHLQHTPVMVRRPPCPVGRTPGANGRTPGTNGRTPGQLLTNFPPTDVASEEEALLAVQRATISRQTASTSKNTTSLRSHALFQLILKKGAR